MLLARFPLSASTHCLLPSLIHLGRLLARLPVPTWTFCSLTFPCCFLPLPCPLSCTPCFPSRSCVGALLAALLVPAWTCCWRAWRATSAWRGPHGGYRRGEGLGVDIEMAVTWCWTSGWRGPRGGHMEKLPPLYAPSMTIPSANESRCGALDCKLQTVLIICRIRTPVVSGISKAVPPEGGC